VTATARLKGVWQIPAQTRAGLVWYVYAWRGRGAPRIWSGPDKLPRDLPLDHPAVEAYRQARQSAGATKPETFAHLLARFETSPKFKRLAPSTQAEYLRDMARIRAQWGKLPLRLLAAPSFRTKLLDWRDSFCERRRREDGRTEGGERAADKLLGVFSAVCAFGVDRGLIAANPAADAERLHSVDLSDDIWTPEERARFKAACFAGPRPKPYVWDAVELALLTGLSRSDALAVPDHAFGAQTLAWRRKKTGAPVLAPMYPALSACVERIRADRRARKVAAIPLLTNSLGRPWAVDGFDTVFGRIKADAGIEKRFHDLRGTFVTEAIIAGLDVAEVAMITGWQAARVEAIARRYVSRNAVVASIADRLQKRQENQSG